jgi:ribosome-binding protein aMBF1 (putative translation factor)
LNIAEKIERLKSEVRKVEMYELMTTNQYRNNIAHVIEILEDLAAKYSE